MTDEDARWQKVLFASADTIKQPLEVLIKEAEVREG
jgi:hypothetical protein